MTLPFDYVTTRCKIGQGAACCKYLVVAGAKGFQCAKLTAMRVTIDARTDMNAKGDNCEGVPEP